LRMLSLPGEKQLMSLVEIKVVKQTKALIQRSPGDGDVRCPSRSWQRRQTDRTADDYPRRSSLEHVEAHIL
ncbi:MAG TPA: hypothetical protein VK513_17125, partial [Terriglobales bacterium]|nr:hypothetical protein [Terriglobales bacterium]